MRASNPRRLVPNNMLRRALLINVSLTVLLFATAQSRAQTPKPSATPPDEKTEGQEPVKVFTEEVRLPVVATDAGGHFDSLEVDDVLVLEDGQPQTIRSVRHIPANVVIVLDTGGGDLLGLGGQSKRTSTT